nr:PREDICTED: A-kinase anchor protein 6 isoform X2 [Latimeria chalumnae]|eukprot:XP_014350188.1 PREDICTED: A-kinase anchor protein 6 isoform X2 [Latimeria chalumnae]
MSVAFSPMISEELGPMATDTSPMVTNMTPIVETGGEEGTKEMDPGQRYEKPPPLHTGADWKVVLHLPEIETWLRMTSERVRDLTYSVQQDTSNKHVDVHLVQLKDICEDISDHVEQIHALLETEFSLKLLSYSVNIIVDIHTVQLLWHQLRVSVLVLRERILQGLQDTNGNYTRQTDILQSFAEETKEARLNSLTEVDDSGQLTIKCSQDYFSLDCGITAFELSDYSPSEDLTSDLETMTSNHAKRKPLEARNYKNLERDFPELVQRVGLLAVANNPLASNQGITISVEGEPTSSLVEDSDKCKEVKMSPKTVADPALSPSGGSLTNKGMASSSNHSISSDDKKPRADSMKKKLPQTQQKGFKEKQHHHNETATPKRPIRDCFNYNEISPTQPSLPKKGLFQESMSKDDLGSHDDKIQMSLFTLKSELSRSTPSLLDTPDRSKLWLDLHTPYSSNVASAVSQSYDCLNKISDINIRNLINKPSVPVSVKAEECNQQEQLKIKKSSDVPKGGQHRQSTAIPAISPPQLYSLESMPSSKSMTPLYAQHSEIQALDTEGRDCCRHNPTSPSSHTGEDLTCTSKSKSGSQTPKPSASSQKTSSPAGSATFIPSASALPKHTRTKSGSALSQLSTNGKNIEMWYGSDEYLALPSHLKESERLALKLENLAKVLPQRPLGETLQNIDDWDLSEMNSDCDLYLPVQIRMAAGKTGVISPTSSSDIAPSLDDSIESGPLSDILSDEDLPIQDSTTEKYTKEKFQRPWPVQASEVTDSTTLSKSTLIQQLQKDIQHQDNYQDIWGKIEGFVSKLDELIQWLYEAMETTENWTPPRPETDSLKLYLETHLSFKLNVDSHCALKDAVVEEGRQLLDLIVSHKSGLKDMLQMITSQWKELQRQIKRQHSWILRALDIIKAEILATDVSAEGEEGTGSPKGEVQLCHLEAKRDAVEQMSLKLYSEQYSSSNKRKQQLAEMSKVNKVGSSSLLDFESESEELWDWLIDMESIVMDSHDLMMSEEQQQHLYKGYNVEMSLWQPKKMELLSKVEDLQNNSATVPSDLLEKVDLIQEKWELLRKTLGEKIQSTVVGQNGLGPRDLLSPESGSLVRQLEVRIKELKGWLRDTELFIFNSCLRQESEGTMDAEKQLQYFKSLCCEIKQRRRGVASVLRLCQRLLDDQDTCSLDADQQSMQLIIVNLERRWEAIIMQAIQWQTRLQKKLGKEQESLNIIDPVFLDLNGSGEDALEWDETDISNDLISINEDSCDLQPECKDAAGLESDPIISAVHSLKHDQLVTDYGSSLYCSHNTAPSSNPRVYQVYSLHNVELYDRRHMPFFKNIPEFPSLKQPHVFMKSLSKDSSFSSTESLPDLLGGIISVRDGKYIYSGDTTRRSESESGIVSEGDTEMTTNSEICLLHRVEEAQRNFAVDPLQSQVAENKDDCSLLKETSRENKSTESTQNIQSLAFASYRKEGDLDLLNIYKNSSKCLTNGLQGKEDALAFYDYSYLQSSEYELPRARKPAQAEKEYIDENPVHDGSSAKIKYNNEQLLLDSQPNEFIHGSSMGALSEEFDPSPGFSSVDDEKTYVDVKNEKQSTLISCGSSLESLSVAGDIFGSSNFKAGEALQRSTSLESWLFPYKSNEELFSQHGSGDITIVSDSVGELSKRTLDLLKRLENIQNPLNPKMKRSISDITLQSISQKISLAGPLSIDIASSVNEDSAASLTELSSSEEVSLCSEDIVVQNNRIPDSNASFRKHLNQSTADETDVSISMIVNVSCTSACTDDDEDDSDLLSSSTLTLTEEELYIKNDDDSSIDEDDDIYEDSNFTLGIDYIKNELQNLIRPRFSMTREKKKNVIGDEIQCSMEPSKYGTSLTTTDERSSFLSSCSQKLIETNGNKKSELICQKSSILKKKPIQDDTHTCREFVDDMENGNINKCQQTCKDRINTISEGGKTHSLNCGRVPKDEPCKSQAVMTSSAAQKLDTKCTSIPIPKLSTNSALESQKHVRFGVSSNTSPVSHSILKRSCTVAPPKICDVSIQHNSTQEAVPNYHRNEKVLASDYCIADSHTTDPASEDDDKLCPNDVSCCDCQSCLYETEKADDSSVHDFVMEIIDMASTALKSKSQPDSEANTPASVAQIREKVLEHSHRPLQLRKGDFYSYLSLSSHDSDCGEVSTCAEEKSSTPLPFDFDQPKQDGKEEYEFLFEACEEEKEQIDQEQCLYTHSSSPQRSFLSVGNCDASHKQATPLECSNLTLTNASMEEFVPNAVSIKYQKAVVISKGVSNISLSSECHNEVASTNHLPCDSQKATVRDPFDHEKTPIKRLSTLNTAMGSGQATMTKKDTLLHYNIKLKCSESGNFEEQEKPQASLKQQQKYVKKECSPPQESISALEQTPCCSLTARLPSKP